MFDLRGEGCYITPTSLRFNAKNLCSEKYEFLQYYVLSYYTGIAEEPDTHVSII